MTLDEAGELFFVSHQPAGLRDNQWHVRATETGPDVCFVTLRLITQPPYNIRWPDGRDEGCEDTDAVLAAIAAGTP